jgi:hypothetical protein
MPNTTYSNPHCYLVGVEISKFLTTYGVLQGDPLSPVVLYLTNNSRSMVKVNGSVQCKYIPIYIQQDATLYSLFISGNFSTCYGW